MTKEEYGQYVQSIADHVLNVCSAQEAIDAKKDFNQWYEEQENNNAISDVLNTQYFSDWKFATQVLGLTATNPNDIDSCLYENCHWQLMLVRLSQACWDAEVREALEKGYTTGDWSSAVLPIPTYNYQLGFFPELKKYKISLGEAQRSMAYNNAYKLKNVGSRQFMLYIASDSVRIIEKEIASADRGATPEPLKKSFGLFFDTVESENSTSHITVTCSRVGTYFNQDIQAALQFAREHFGVHEVKTRKSKK